LNIKNYVSKNTPQEHLKAFYKNIDHISDQKYDGMIITGAPVEHLEFEKVSYWDEIKEIFEWSKHNVTSTFYICWAAQAGLYYHYGIPKYPIKSKMFGIFSHNVNFPNIPLVRGFDDEFLAPHSRFTEVRKEDILKVKDLVIVSESDEAGIYIVMKNGGNQIFVTGHSEYEAFTLKNEYDRDIAKGLSISVPKNYFPDDDPSKSPRFLWKGHASLLYANWLNYYVYQATPFKLEEL
jgi:homoserine O-succinyltransferase